MKSLASRKLPSERKKRYTSHEGTKLQSCEYIHGMRNKTDTAKKEKKKKKEKIHPITWKP